MEIKKFIELSRNSFKLRPSYSEVLTPYPPEYWSAKVNQALETILPSSEQLLLRNAFDKWIPSSEEQVLLEADNFITGFGRRSISTCSGVTHMELRLYDCYKIPFLNGHSNRLLVDLFAIEETRLGDGSAYYDKDSRQWGFTQQHGVRHYPSHFMVMAL